MIGRIANGASPPIQNTARQPRCGMTAAARKPPMAAPSEKKQTSNVVSRFRLRSGAYSAVRAIPFGIAPPSPRPARNRNVMSCSTDAQSAQAIVNTPKTRAQSTIVGLRPWRSATGPNTSAPSIKPASPLLKIGPSSARLTPHSRTIAGAT